jgi:hypothetical protein
MTIKPTDGILDATITPPDKDKTLPIAKVRPEILK